MLNSISEIMLACFKSNTYIILCNTIIIVVEAIENSVEWKRKINTLNTNLGKLQCQWYLHAIIVSFFPI